MAFHSKTAAGPCRWENCREQGHEGKPGPGECVRFPALKRRRRVTACLRDSAGRSTAGKERPAVRGGFVLRFRLVTFFCRQAVPRDDALPTAALEAGRVAMRFSQKVPPAREQERTEAPAGRTGQSEGILRQKTREELLHQILGVLGTPSLPADRRWTESVEFARKSRARFRACRFWPLQSRNTGDAASHRPRSFSN